MAQARLREREIIIMLVVSRSTLSLRGLTRQTAVKAVARTSKNTFACLRKRNTCRLATWQPVLQSRDEMLIYGKRDAN